MRILKTGAQAAATALLTALLFGSPALFVLLALLGFSPPPPAIGEDGEAPQAATVTLPPSALEPESEPEPVEVSETTSPVEPPEVVASADPSAKPRSFRPRFQKTRLRRAELKKTTERARNKTRKKKKKGKRCTPDDRIRSVGPGRYHVAESWFEQNAKLNTIGSSAYLAWHENALGKRDGFQIKRLRCGPLWEIGLRPRDVVHSVNDKRVRTLAKAFVVYQSLKNKRRFRIKLTRKGEPMVLHYEVVADASSD